ncbi:Ras family [Chlorella sorokiniana]|uniref:Ras family n=1 Tax=Chlorella sorokiniana TaxID=3076 RepID=A0A2P6TFS5_CHLSO|nr:Ras family [Chlorella sorokiniana]|eukprot:PRW32960.1 Ras family [Chlorella sorokiniana]
MARAGSEQPPPPSPPIGAGAAASSPLRLPWEEHIPLLLRHLHDQADRWALRLVCRDWRTAVDHACHKAALDISASEAPATLQRGAQFLLPHVSELVLADASDLAQQLPGLLPTLPRSAPALRALVVSAPLGRQAAVPDWLAQLPLQLQRLELVDVPLPEGRLESVSHLQQLTELSLSLTAVAPGSTTSAAGVACLTCLRGLQALEMPLLGEEEREALSRLTGLTRLAFTASGRGAVGPSLRPLTRLRDLTLRLWHVHEHFLVLHPRLDWSSLATLVSLRRLEICHLAANTLFVAPEVTWLDEAPAAHQADLLVGALPAIEQLKMRLSYCRLAEEHVTGDEPEELLMAHPHTGSPHRFLRSVEPVPVRLPGRRRPDAWYTSWWVQAVQAQLATKAAAAEQGGGGAEDPAQRFLAERGEVGGYAAMRPGNHRTYDVLVQYARHS